MVKHKQSGTPKLRVFYYFFTITGYID